MTYNITALQNADRVSDIALFANTASEGILMSGLMIAIFIILLMVFKKYEFTHGFAVASFLCFVLSSVLAYNNYINFYTVLVFLILTAFSVFYMFVVQR